MPYVGILTSVLGYVSTEHYSYQELFHEVNIQTGGIASSINVYGDAKEYRAYTPVYTVRAKALYGQMPSVFALLGEILFTSQLEDEKRLNPVKNNMRWLFSSSLRSRFIITGRTVYPSRLKSILLKPPKEAAI